MKRCNRTNCVNHDTHNRIKYDNGCVALKTLYRSDNECKVFKEVKDGDNKGNKV